MKKNLLISLLVLSALNLFAQTKFRTGVFLHLDVGNNIWGPNGSPTSVPDEIDAYNYLNGYTGSNACGLQQQTFPANPNNNEWYRWNLIFNNLDPNNDIQQKMQANRIIVIKTGFTASAITGWGSSSDTLLPINKTVYNYKWHWRKIVKIMASHPEVFFIIWTNAPLVASATTDQEAVLSHNFSRWAKDTLATGLDQYGDFPSNIYIFDYFHKVAGPDYKLQPQYAVSPDNSLPNATATELIAPQFVNEIFDASIQYEAGYAQLQPPEIIYPTQNETNVPVNPIIKWKKVTGASQYRIQIATDIQYNNVVVDDFTSETSYQVKTSLKYNTQYMLHIKAIAGQAESAWNFTIRFTTVIEPPNPPSLIYPGNDSIQIPLKPTFRWSPSQRADEYWLQVARDKEFNLRVINTGFIIDTFYVPSETLEYNTKYYWHIKARNAGGESQWSDSSVFTTVLPLPDKPVLSSPENNASKIPLDIVLKWHKAANAQEYILRISENPGFQSSIVSNKTTDTSFKLTNQLKYGTKYYWAVNSINPSGSGDTSEIWSFKTIKILPHMIILTSPINNTSNVPLQPTFIWNEDGNAELYDLQIATDTSMASLHYNLRDIVDTKYKYDASTDPTFNSNTKYYWRVKAKNEAGEGEWSNVWAFTTEAAEDVGDKNIPKLVFENGELQVFPNPANERITIKYYNHEHSTPTLPKGKGVKIKIYNVLGAETSRLIVSEGNGEMKVDVSELPLGIYYVEYRSDSIKKRAGFIISR